LGIVDQFQKKGFNIFGPDKRAAKIEGSKGFAKDLMAKYHIQTPEYNIFSDAQEAIQCIHELEPPIVIKADGLASGKGVLICQNRNEAFENVERIMKKKVFGEAGKRIIVEEFITGEEVSVLAITDGERLVTLPPTQDHKHIFEGDTGPNTGGMGAYAPVPVVNDKMMKVIREKILIPVIEGMKKEGRPYKGVLYAGLMITPSGPKVLEFNCRFGDPETQVILPLLETDLVDLMMESAEGRLKETPVKVLNQSAVCVIMASGGYPEAYEKGKMIQGLNQFPRDIFVFHSGTKLKKNKLVTSGGRVLGVTAMDDTIDKAVHKVYKAVGKITFDGAYYRS
jgi:phosphoribosylamine--glycine ligase